MLTDFGIAKALDDTRSITGMAAIGTPAYMAPEIALGQLATPKSDQYSLGCLAYELLSGDLPFFGDAGSLREAHVERQPIPLAQAAPQISHAVAAAIDAALAKNPAARHADVRALAGAVRAVDIAFQRSQKISSVIASAGAPAEAVGRLIAEHGLSDNSISQITNLDRTEVVRLRRRQARLALAGRRPT